MKKIAAKCPRCGKHHKLVIADAKHQYFWSGGNVLPRLLCLKCKDILRNRNNHLKYEPNYRRGNGEA